MLDEKIPESIGGLTGWVIAILTSATAFMFKLLQSAQYKQLEDVRVRCDWLDKKQQECQEDRILLAKRVSHLEAQKDDKGS